MSRVTSRDGTPIAYDRQGAGPPVILVGGGLDDGSENAPLAAELADRFTVYNFARRGRGESGDTEPYAVERELEDLEALIGQAGGSADRLATITQPTLVLTGGGAEFFELAADAVAAAVPGAERVVLEGQGHVADPKAVATVLQRFLNG